MKKACLIIGLGISVSSCTATWEYKVVSVKGMEDNSKMRDFHPKKFDASGESLNLFGKEGWELVEVFETTETIHPNFGNDEYVSGIQPNVRTSEINFVFKRKK